MTRQFYSKKQSVAAELLRISCTLGTSHTLTLTSVFVMFSKIKRLYCHLHIHHSGTKYLTKTKKEEYRQSNSVVKWTRQQAD